MPVEKKQYDTFAAKYSNVTDLPCSKIEADLIRTALGDCTGLSVLDIGGGSGLHARRAIDEANASSVDVVDISQEMLRVGQTIPTQKEGGLDRIHWLEADASKPLAEQISGDQKLKEGGYDVVMANWVFDHATSLADLRGMWENVVGQLKSGGKFLGVRVYNMKPEYMVHGKYGATFSEIEEIPGQPGLKYVCGCLTDPPFSFGCTSMEETLTLADTIPKELGLVDLKVVPFEETDTVKADPEFWGEFLKSPNLAVVVGRKP
ncbi:Ubiquinone/menaquinone biosynthesis C-methyltransferase UbiE [Podospora australis]|uniref:Ubiquinone/menaquinone biosynthesis C-methyltransferase UbiE n=1 Tax=Podospora australis TaxID=1536484 RepID=A0AAN6WI19_9PEZI|nr:Ubiquinone/menaquinone biosynthesis C-methyltransferase UbiE [Podospora australis]